MRPCDEPRPTPDWCPQAAPCRICGIRDYGHECDDLAIPPNVILSDN